MDRSPSDARKERLRLREVLWRVSSLPSCRKCGRVPLGPQVVVEVNGDGDARMGGLTTCGSVWACPMCSATIRAGRAGELSGGLSVLIDDGCTVLFSTLTMPHDFGDELCRLLPSLKRAWHYVIAAREWRAVRSGFDCIGLVRSLEVTCGCHGWHPHVHLLFVFARALSDEEVAAFDAVLFDRFVSGIEREGYRPPSREHGVTTKRVVDSSGIANYVAKVESTLGAAIEIAGANMKRGRASNLAPFQLLEAAGAGDARSRLQYRNYEQAFRGSRAVLWSPGLKHRAGVDDVSDDEVLSSVGVGFVPLFGMDSAIWSHFVREVPGFTSALLQAVERGGSTLGSALVSALMTQTLEVVA